MEKLKLEKPIAFIDVETTGKRPRSAKIVELSIFRIQPDGPLGGFTHFFAAAGRN